MLRKIGQDIRIVFTTRTQITLISICLILSPIFVKELRNSEAGTLKAVNQIQSPASTTLAESGSMARTLEQYYARRQYHGSPPALPHPDEVHGKRLECLMCHKAGGWTTQLKRITPVTPHPELSACWQCHVWPAERTLFRAIDWRTLPPPRLGRSYLPGAPPPIPHAIQMRKNCNACHVGSGTIAAIRMKHQWRGTCRQCHVPDPPLQPFRR